MHRAERASSKLCREREVEKAQELHRRKIESVKSYVSAITHPAVGGLSSSSVGTSTTSTVSLRSRSTFFRRQQRHQPVKNQTKLTAASATNIVSSPWMPTPPPPQDARGSMVTQMGDEPDHTRPLDGEQRSDDTLKDANANEDGLDHGSEPSTPVSPSLDASFAVKTFDKLDEFRSVLVPVMAYDTERGPDPRVKKEMNKITPQRATGAPVTLHGSFRWRRLKQIDADNATLQMRLKKSTAHYRGDDMRRDWEQNLAYLNAICEFPVQPSGLSHAGACNGTKTRAPNSPRHRQVKTPMRAELPRLTQPVESHSTHPPPINHAIRAIPTSPRRAQLNLSPAFRSLRKGLPQQPSLPPLTAGTSSNRVSTSIIPAAMAMKPIEKDVVDEGNEGEDDDDGEEDEEEEEMQEGYAHGEEYSDTEDGESDGEGQEREEAEDDTSSFKHHGHLTTHRIVPSHVRAVSGALAGASSGAASATASRYTLVTVGRFVGGAYLVLTVLCGDGITNPYGFDVMARNPATQCAVTLSVTKAATRAFLDMISSSSLAATTAAAAGTNLSMEHIARSLCDHVNVAALEPPHVGQMLFLIASASVCTDASSDDGDDNESEKNQEGEEDTGCIPGHRLEATHCLLANVGPAVSAFSIQEEVEAQVPHHFGHGRAYHYVQAHIFASTRPPRSCRASMSAPRPRRQRQRGHIDDNRNSNSDAGLVCFQVQLHARDLLELEVPVDEVRQALEKRSPTMHGVHGSVSLECVLMWALRHLHIKDEAESAESEDIRLKLVFDGSIENDWSPTATNRNMAVLPRSTTSVPWLLQSGLVWKQAYLLVRVGLVSPGDEIQDAGPEQCVLLVYVFNASTRAYSERELDAGRVVAFARLLTMPSPTGSESEVKLAHWDASLLLRFAKRLLSCLHLELDLRGREIITFPSLDHQLPRQQASFTTASACRSNRSPRRPFRSPSFRHVGHTNEEKGTKTVPVSLSPDINEPPNEDDDDGDASRESGCSEDEHDGETMLAPWTYAAFLETMSPECRDEVMLHAALRIQFACRGYLARHASRRNAIHQVEAIKPQRAMTPTALGETSHRGRHRSRHSSLLDGDTNTKDGNDDNLGARYAEVDENYDDDERSQRSSDGDDDDDDGPVDALGVLHEEEDGEHDTASVGTTASNAYDEASSIENIKAEVSTIQVDQMRESRYRRQGSKTNEGQFLLQMYARSEERNAEEWVIATLGSLQRIKR